MVVGGAPHALLLSGPASVGKTTLALDLAAGLLCLAEDPSDRPCRACRACRQLASGNHPDLHRLAPEGPGGQVGIGQVRSLSADLALLPVEGRRRVAIVEAAHRLNEDSQNALLKTLEEPPPEVTIILCADQDDRLLPTVRSRCARLVLGPLSSREIVRFLDERAIADPPTAARLARLSSGRPGVAIALARAPEAVAARAELSRQLIDLLGARPATRLAAMRDLLARAADLARSMAAAISGATGSPPATLPPEDEPDGERPPEAEVRTPAAERRYALALLLDAWRDVARDLALVEVGDVAHLHDPAMLEDLHDAASGISGVELRDFLHRLERAGEQLDVNVSPELLGDALILAWPGKGSAA